MAIIRQTTGLTFDDVLLQPSLSNVLPSETDVTANLTRSIKLNIPIVAAAMDLYICVAHVRNQRSTENAEEDLVRPSSASL